LGRAKDVERAIIESKRVLSRGGHLIIAETDSENVHKTADISSDELNMFERHGFVKVFSDKADAVFTHTMRHISIKTIVFRLEEKTSSASSVTMSVKETEDIRRVSAGDVQSAGPPPDYSMKEFERRMAGVREKVFGASWDMSGSTPQGAHSVSDTADGDHEMLAYDDSADAYSDEELFMELEVLRKRAKKAHERLLAVTDSSSVEEKQDAARELIETGKRISELLVIMEGGGEEEKEEKGEPPDDFEEEMRRLREEMRKWEEGRASSGGQR